MAATLLLIVCRSWAAAPEFDFTLPAAVSDPATRPAMADLASRLIPVYQDADGDRYLATLSALQMAAGDYAAADVSRESLRERRRTGASGRSGDSAVVLDVYAHARAIQQERHLDFANAFARSFREHMGRLDDARAYGVERLFEQAPNVDGEALQRAIDERRGKARISEAGAVAILWAFVAYEAARDSTPLVGALVAEDDGRRYAVESNVGIAAGDGVGIEAIVVRPKNSTKPLPALFEFLEAGSVNAAKEAAAHGYVGVAAFARAADGRHGRRPDPLQAVGGDARAVIEWIARQSWSDGSVGMVGNGFGAFAAWSAAKRLPSALKAIAASASLAPGIDFPMTGSVFHNAAYRWSLQRADCKPGCKSNVWNDGDWQRLNEKWYRSGRRYRDFGRVLGKANPVFIRWLNHPSYDRYWQKMLPYETQFARLEIPVLTVAGYFSELEPGDLYFFAQHSRFNPRADHSLVIGPFADGDLRQGSTALRDSPVDAAALADLRQLRFDWLDHVLKGGAAPAMLKDRITYEVMGTNQWNHAPSIEAMADERIKFYLQGSSSEVNTLTRQPAAGESFVPIKIDFADRTDAGWQPANLLVRKALAARDGAAFISDPLPQPMELSGLFSGRLDFYVNRMDMDLDISLYELLASGDYIPLF
ncbi:MAG: CocE/NonD family hydrolase, partial [Pseudomonadota bacterium]|nr:CocE/NonD family hydrolase [Pseudomonadota bacterium]